MKTIKHHWYILCGILLMCIASQLTIPINPIPITMQTVAVMLIGLCFKPLVAVWTIVFYLSLGAIGLPVFANFTGGIQKLLGPSGGYLWGFLLAVIVMSALKKHLNKRLFSQIMLSCLVGTLIILSVGVSWLAHFIGLKAAFSSGFYPFIIPGIIKIILTSIIFYLLYPVIKKGRN